MNAQDTHTRRRNVMSSVTEAINSMGNEHVLLRAPDDVRSLPESVSISLRSGRLLDVIGFTPGFQERRNHNYSQHEDWNIDLVLRHDDGLGLATVHVDEIDMVSVDEAGHMIEPSKARLAALGLAASIVDDAASQPMPADIAGIAIQEALSEYLRGEFTTGLLKEIGLDPELEEERRIMEQGAWPIVREEGADATSLKTIGELPDAIRHRVMKAVHSDRILKKVKQAYRPFISMDEWTLLATGQ